MLTNDSSMPEENFNEPVKESTWDFSRLLKLVSSLSGTIPNGAVLSYMYKF